MYEPTQDAIWMHGIDLAQEADFDLGSLRVRPARCEVEWNGVSQTLQRRVTQVLVALAQARGSVVSQDDLVIRCWRGLSVSDDAIFRCISKLRKLAAAYPDAPYAIETIPGVGYRLTSSSQVEDDPAAKSAAPPDRRFRLRDLAAAAMLATLVLVGGLIWIDQRSAPDGLQAIRVAVQPFDALSSSEDARALARSIPNEVVNELGDSQIEIVLGEGESGKKAPGTTGLIVTGLLRDDAPNVIVNVRVEDGTTHAAIWSMELKRERRNASDLPMEVAARVADIVNMAIFARSAKPPLTDNSALSALLQTMDMIRDTQGGDWAQMIEHAQEVVTRHPNFAFGHSHLAYAYAEAADGIDVPDQAQAMRDAARREANLTLKLDPQDAGAYAVLWIIEPPYNYQAQEAILLRGIKLAKHPKQPLGALYSFEGSVLSGVGRLREALTYQLVARATDEWGPPKTAKLSLTYASVGNLDAARSWLRQAIQRWPNHSAVRAARLNIAAFYEQPADALTIFDAIDAGARPNENQTRVWRHYIQAKEARSRQVTGAAIQTIREGAANGEIPRETEIMMLAGLGESRRAIAAANLALDRQKLDSRFLFTPVMRDVRRDPDFVSLASRMGLIKYWRETGKRPDFCTDSAAATECSSQLLAAMKS
jgi:DNA-binding winged helix-turn-helix (wHTH) protein/TolB-like protein/tetratricopeptide (TPR) repeat protein